VLADARAQTRGHGWVHAIPIDKRERERERLTVKPRRRVLGKVPGDRVDVIAPRQEDLSETAAYPRIVVQHQHHALARVTGFVRHIMVCHSSKHHVQNSMQMTC
jgi:hypothetical protein